MENMENELAELILDANKQQQSTSSLLTPPPPTRIQLPQPSSSSSSLQPPRISLNIPSIVVSCDNNNSGGLNIKNCNNNANLFFNPCKMPPQTVPTTTITEKSKEELVKQMKQKKLQSLERREPSNVLIMENIGDIKAQLVQSLVEDQNLNFSFSVQLIRYLSHFKSLILVFSHRNEAELCKLLVVRQDSFKLDKDTIVYFGKELPVQAISKYQLNTPFPTRQHLISPPLSPPNEWETPGDGMEHPPNDIDPFAIVTKYSSTTDTMMMIDDNDNDDNEGSGSETPLHHHHHHQHKFNSNNNNIDPEQLSDRLKKIIYKDTTSNGFPSITLEFCT